MKISGHSAQVAFGVAVVITLACLGAPPTLAGTTGSPGPLACSPSSPIYSVSAPAPVWWSAGQPYQTYGASGITIQIDITTGHTWSGTIGGSGSFDISDIVTNAKASVNASITYTTESTITKNGKYTVPSQWAWGWLAFGSSEYNINWTEYVRDSSCSLVTMASGTGHLPVVNTGFNDGEGMSPAGMFG